MKPETRFWKWLSGVLPDGHFSRVEPPPSPGIPDVNYCIDGIEGWLELKVRPHVTYPFKKRQFLRASQRAWFKQRMRVHGRVRACCRIGSRIHLIRCCDALRVRRTTSYDEFVELCCAVIEKRDPNLKEKLRDVLCGLP